MFWRNSLTELYEIACTRYWNPVGGFTVHTHDGGLRKFAYSGGGSDFSQFGVYLIYEWPIE